MGYRSEIAFCITVDQVLEKPETGESFWTYDKAKFKEMVGFFKLTEFYEIATNKEYNLIKAREPNLGWQDGVIMFHASGWKWYEDYPLVQAFNQMWSQMQEIEGISGFYLRSGEESNDIDEQAFGDAPDSEHFHVFTALSFDGEMYLGKTETDDEVKTEPQVESNNVSANAV